MEELKHGIWELISKQHGNATDGFWTERFLKCSVCGYERRDAWIPRHKPNYCEECGEDMRGTKDGCN
jgi:hypothetical protein